MGDPPILEDWRRTPSETTPKHHERPMMGWRNPAPLPIIDVSDSSTEGENEEENEEKMKKKINNIPS